ncbi:MAG TPA: hypothetical protein VGB42_08230 [Candidatus Thermoplasmatota archaeon]
MRLLVPAGLPRALPRLAASRLEALGFGSTVTREQIAGACGTQRAGDQFIHTWTQRGLLVPARWGAYFVAPERVASLSLAARLPSHARMVAWAQLAPRQMGLPRRPTFLGPVLWEHTDLSVDSPAPVLPLRKGDTRIPATPPQLEAFAADLGWAPEPLEVRVGDLATVRGHAVRPGDAAWILSLNLSPRIRAAGESLMGALPARDRARARAIRRLANFAALSPSGSRPLRLMVGPPGQYRVFAPRWFMEPHLEALQSQARRAGDG